MRLLLMIPLAPFPRASSGLIARYTQYNGHQLTYILEFVAGVYLGADAFLIFDTNPETLCKEEGLEVNVRTGLGWASWQLKKCLYPSSSNQLYQHLGNGKSGSVGTFFWSRGCGSKSVGVQVWIRSFRKNVHSIRGGIRTLP